MMKRKRKVFGIGLNKTGTTTLASCLQHLGYRHMSARRDLLEAWFKRDLYPLFRVCDDFDSFEDWPYPLAYKDLFFRYGNDARYILTVRSTPKSWLESLKNHSLQTDPLKHCRLLAYGYNYPHGFEREHLKFYETHTSEVTSFFKNQGSEHLLSTVCWENGDDWAVLCDFLGEPLPLIPFPHENKMSAPRIRESPFFNENTKKIAEQLGLLGKCL